MVGELRHAGVSLDQAVGELERMGRRETDPLDAAHRRDMVNQGREVDNGAVGHRARVGVHVLAEERDLHDTLRGETPDLLDHAGEGPAHFIPARVRHDAEAAVLAATFHDRHECGRALGAGRRQVIEFLDLGEAHIDDGAAGALHRADHFRQAVQGLRAEHQVDERRARRDRLPFLARDATGDTDQHFGPQLLELAPLAEQRIHLVLGFLAHGAGVHQQQIGLRRIARLDVAFGHAQDVRHARGVVLIHLAAESLEEIAAGHGRQGVQTGQSTEFGRNTRSYL